MRVTHMPHALVGSLRQGNDLWFELTISLTEALVGFQTRIKHLDGQLQISIPVGAPTECRRMCSDMLALFGSWAASLPTQSIPRHTSPCTRLHIAIAHSYLYTCLGHVYGHRAKSLAPGHAVTIAKEKVTIPGEVITISKEGMPVKDQYDVFGNLYRHRRRRCRRHRTTTTTTTISANL